MTRYDPAAAIASLLLASPGGDLDDSTLALIDELAELDDTLERQQPEPMAPTQFARQRYWAPEAEDEQGPLQFLRQMGHGALVDVLQYAWTQDMSYAGTGGKNKWVNPGQKPRYQVGQPQTRQPKGAPAAPTPKPQVEPEEPKETPAQKISGELFALNIADIDDAMAADLVGRMSKLSRADIEAMRKRLEKSTKEKITGKSLPRDKLAAKLVEHQRKKAGVPPAGTAASSAPEAAPASSLASLPERVASGEVSLADAEKELLGMGMKELRAIGTPLGVKDRAIAKLAGKIAAVWGEKRQGEKQEVPAPQPEAAPVAPPVPEPEREPEAPGRSVNGVHLTATHERLIGLMQGMDKDYEQGATISIPALREKSGLPKAEFDQAVLDLAAADLFDLHGHVTPQRLSPEKRDELVTDGEGGYFIGIARRMDDFVPEPQPEAPPGTPSVSESEPQSQEPQGALEPAATAAPEVTAPGPTAVAARPIDETIDDLKQLAEDRKGQWNDVDRSNIERHLSGHSPEELAQVAQSLGVLPGSAAEIAQAATGKAPKLRTATREPASIKQSVLDLARHLEALQPQTAIEGVDVRVPISKLRSLMPGMSREEQDEAIKNALWEYRKELKSDPGNFNEDSEEDVAGQITNMMGPTGREHHIVAVRVSPKLLRQLQEQGSEAEGPPQPVPKPAPVPNPPRPPKGGAASAAGASGKGDNSPVTAIPANQASLVSKIWKEANERDLNDSMRELGGVNLKQRDIPHEVASQFYGHGANTLSNLVGLLNGGIDKNRQFFEENLGTSEGSHRLLRDNSPFVLLGHPGKTLAEGGIGGVLVDDLHAPSIPDLQKAFPGVKFVPAKDAATVLGKVASPPKGAPGKGEKPALRPGERAGQRLASDSAPPASTPERHSSLARALDPLFKSGRTVTVADLRKALPGWSSDDVNKAILQLQASRAISGTVHEGRADSPEARAKIKAIKAAGLKDAQGQAIDVLTIGNNPGAFAQLLKGVAPHSRRGNPVLYPRRH